MAQYVIKQEPPVQGTQMLQRKWRVFIASDLPYGLVEVVTETIWYDADGFETSCEVECRNAENVWKAASVEKALKRYRDFNRFNSFHSKLSSST